ncbi:histidinol dehydrogenase [Methanoregula formicica]|uniref:Histidinol dehydrogenase n=1 Tax=Methanoregula formicica (strain DSM 22288 / NBRC 105244 / SMSP) TaxID=593750 RepID=L0HEL5_METFS|nr:histidinol dehydrogenase [Methanoregula formicica]AGB01753.1 histidinol dehydrogenase [Methanoregula formicica SMSP]
MWKAVGIDAWLAARKTSLEDARGTVTGIIGRVKNEGDAALIDLAKKYCTLEHVAVTDEERESAYDEVDAQVVEALIEAHARIERFHERQRPRDLWFEEMEPGVVLGMKSTGLNRVGLYVPGGRAAYPSSALMCAVPAKVAGVKEICACSPPPIKPLTLVALDIAGVTEIYQAGGAQAVAAMALGTESIRPVQKIVGPGNIYVTLAKMMLREHAEIDFPAGPSEIGIIADSTAHPKVVAADVLAQAEHDPNAACILITTDPTLPAKVGKEIEKMVAEAPRKEIIVEALKNSGYTVVKDIDEAIAASDVVAPEHLSIQVADPLMVVTKVQNAGAIFVGRYSAVACGDYAVGTNHCLPTAGYSKMYSGLDVAHFCKTASVEIIDRDGLEAIGDIVETIAEAEGLYAHSQSVKVRRAL